MYYIYIIRCEGGELYTGITTNIRRRIQEHCSGSRKCAKYTKSHKIVALEALWSAENRSLASGLEFRIKKLPREKKLKLIADPNRVSELTGFQENFTLKTDEISDIYIKNPLD